MAEENLVESGASRQQVDASGRPTGIYRLLLICGIVGSVLFHATYLIAGAIRPGYDPWKQPMSVLSLGDGGWVQIANFIVFGILIICFASGLRIALTPGRADTWGPILQIIVALCLILAGIFSQDPVPGYPIGTIAAPNPPTTHAVIHVLATFGAFILRVIWCFVIARRFAIEPRWRGWASFAIADGIAMMVLLALFGMGMANGGPGGAFEKLASITASVLSVALTIRLLSGVGFTNHSKG